MVVTHEPTARPFATKYAHSVFGQERETLDEAYPGDIVALVNATDVRVGDTLVEAPVEFPRLPSSPPSTSSRPGRSTPGRYKQFRKGVAQLDEEGVVQVLRDPDLGDQAPVFAAVGPMQLEVASWRLEHEFGSQAELSPTPYNVARRTDEASAPALRGMPGVQVLSGPTARSARLFESPYWLAGSSPRAPSSRSTGSSPRAPRAESRRQQVVPSSGLEVDQVGRRCRRRTARRCRRPCARRLRR